MKSRRFHIKRSAARQSRKRQQLCRERRLQQRQRHFRLLHRRRQSYHWLVGVASAAADV